VPVPAGLQEQAVTPVRHVVYLHGFASSPESGKAVRFGRELEAHGVGFTCPDLNQPDFRTLTTTRMLAQTAAAIEAAEEGPVCLVGSSLGAFVALHAAAADTTGRVDRLILLAPAFDFGGNRLRSLGEQGIDEWRRAGSLRVMHYAQGVEQDVDFALYEDAARYDAWAVIDTKPTLIVQGRRDDVVDPEMVTRWASGRPSVDLRLLDDGHQLADSIDRIWRDSEAFLGLTPAPARPA
jgi:pimeloyl-ACP methyl ester carboxylesterase